MSKDNITTAPVAATLTEQELFNRFLDAPSRSDAPRSTLVDYDEVEQSTLDDHIRKYICGWCESVCFGDDMPDRIIEELRNCEDPEDEIKVAIGDAKSILNMLETLELEFSVVTRRTRTPEPEETGDDEADSNAYREWENNPRYVLPVIKSSVEAA